MPPGELRRHLGRVADWVADYNGRLDGRYVLRLVVSGLRVREADVQAAWALVQRCLHNLRAI